jgi:hypothetical protein
MLYEIQRHKKIKDLLQSPASTSRISTGLKVGIREQKKVASDLIRNQESTMCEKWEPSPLKCAGCPVILPNPGHMCKEAISAGLKDICDQCPVVIRDHGGKVPVVKPEWFCMRCTGGEQS